MCHFSSVSHGCSTISELLLKFAKPNCCCKSDIANLMDITSIERYLLSQRIILILTFIDNMQLCRGAPMENGESTTLSHTIGEYVDLTEGAKNVGETKVFSTNCAIACGRDSICCMNCRKIKLFGARVKQWNLARDTIHPSTNKRYISKCVVVQQLVEERQAEKRECYWKDNFHSQCIEMNREDHEDLSQMFLNTGDQNVPAEMASLWQQQRNVLECKSKDGYQWHPKKVTKLYSYNHDNLRQSALLFDPC